MKTELNIIETLFTIKFDKELQAILKKDLAAYKQRAAVKRKTLKTNIPAAA